MAKPTYQQLRAVGGDAAAATTDGFAAGMPVGGQVITSAFREGRALPAAAVIEAAVTP
ncbi:hypothetical protein ACFXJ5_03975 [Streptomyces sp. NPDC059373]